MELILPHENTDFDALACLFAACRIYEGALPILGRRVIGPVRDYLGLHRDRFATHRASDVDLDGVTRVVLVDNRRADRLPPVRGLTERLEARDSKLDVHVYDHHPSTDRDVVGSLEKIEPVGAAVTLFVEALRERGETIDSAEATLFALGIYSDTGALRFASTTGRDAAAVAFLLDRGASLEVVNHYTRTAFDAEQRRALSMMLEATRTIDLHGDVKVAMCEMELGHFVAGLAPVVRHVQEIEGHDALFGVFRMGRRGTEIIGRSSVPYVDVGRVLGQLGGGGHPAAGAARLHEGQDEDAESRLVTLLHRETERPMTVADVMSSPVRSVSPTMPLETLDQSLTAWSHTGVPVVSAGKLLGIVSRRDVESARRDGRLALPVSSCMTNRVVTVTPETSLRNALSTMSEANVGRVPVLRNGRVVGILSRSDAMRLMYRDRSAQAT